LCEEVARERRCRSRDTEAPIYADEAVLDEAGVLFEADEEEHEVEQFREFLDNITPEDFAQ
jgi:bifunctional DNase/RNase